MTTSGELATAEAVAFVGYGKMGAPMGRRLLAAGHPLIVFDIDSHSAATAADDGAELAASGADAAAAADTVITMLPTPSATVAATTGETGVVAGLRSGAIWLEMSSSDPAITRELAAAARKQGAELLDAPVSGGVVGATDGMLTIMVGGHDGVLERALPVLEVLGGEIFHVGTEPGDGDLAKSINNLLSAVNLTAASEAVALGIRGGLDPSQLVSVIGSSSGSSHALTMKLPTYVLTGAFDAGFTIDQMLKDLRILHEVAMSLGVPTFVGSLVHDLWTSFAAEGHGGQDHTVVAELMAGRAGTSYPPPA